MRKLVVITLLFFFDCLFCFGKEKIDFSISSDETYIKCNSDNTYELFVLQKSGINSVMLVDSQVDIVKGNETYALRAFEYNPINGNEIRILDGKKLVSNYSKYSIISSNVIYIPELGNCFQLHIPEKIIYGYAWTRNGIIETSKDFIVNIRTFEKKYCDYSGGFGNNLFRFTHEKKVIKTKKISSKKTENKVDSTIKVEAEKEVESVIKVEAEKEVESVKKVKTRKKDKTVKKIEVEKKTKSDTKAEMEIKPEPFLNVDVISKQAPVLDMLVEPEVKEEIFLESEVSIQKENYESKGIKEATDDIQSNEEYYEEESEDFEKTSVYFDLNKEYFEEESEESDDVEKDPEIVVSDEESNIEESVNSGEEMFFEEKRVLEEENEESESFCYETIEPEVVPDSLGWGQCNSDLVFDDYRKSPHEKTKMPFVYVKGEKKIKNLYVAKTEMTIGQYAEIMNESMGSRNNYPVTEISKYLAMQICNRMSEKFGLTPCYSINGISSSITHSIVPEKADKDWDNAEYDETADGFRLLTIEEWLYCAQGGKYHSKTKFSGGKKADEVSWNGRNSGGSTHEVATKKANELGLYDMTGNVSEICWGKTNDKIRKAAVRGGNFTYIYDIFLKNKWNDRCQSWYRHYENGLRICRTAN